MTDDRLLELLDRLVDAPRLVVGRRKYFYDERLDALVVWTRVGKSDRWSLSPSSGVVPMARVAEHWFEREVRTWAERERRMNFAAHARAMSVRVL